jgi:membrane protease YdiL (CAAX protease family)
MTTLPAPVIVFVAITYALAIGLSLVIGFTGGYRSPLIGLGYVTTFFPAAAVLVVRLSMGERLRIDWRRLPVKYIPIALFMMPLVLHVVMMPLVARAEGGLPWQSWLTRQSDGLFHPPAQLGWGTLGLGGLAFQLALNAALGLIIVSFLAFFEELGWRGWMLPRLIDWIGPRSAVIAGALISGLWHVPFSLSGIHHLEGVSVAVTVAIMAIGLVGAAMVIGWLWLHTESIWIVVLAHGALNNWGQYAFKFMQNFQFAENATVLAAGNLALLIVGILLVSREPSA